ncbi:MAG: proton-conducting transporter membrane subunit [Pseudomonadota bacterium]
MRALFSLPFVLVAGAAAAQEAPASTVPDPFLIGNTPLTAWLVAIPIIVPLIGAGVLVALRSVPRVHSLITLVMMAVVTLAAVALNGVVAANGPLVMAMGNWVPPFGIVIAVDQLGALFVLVTSLVGLLGLAYARQEIDEKGVTFGFYAFYLLLMCGVNGAFSTGDIFNLYVWFEVFLIASFGLMAFGGERVQMDGAVKYGVLNLIATTLFLIAVGVLYGATGTLNMADIRTVLAQENAAPLLTIGALFTMAFAMKAAAFPLHFWLPASYHTPKIIVSALFAGLLTKVGVYCLLRVIIMLFGDEGTAFLPFLLVFGAATAVIGALCAIAQVDAKRMAAFLVVSGIGVMLIGIGLGTEKAFTGAIVYAVHSIFVMTALFLVLGLAASAGRIALHEALGLYASRALIAALFLIVGFAAAGLPPFSGFWPKFLLVDAALDGAGGLGTLATVGVILSGFLTTIAVGRTWALIFLKPAGEGVVAPDGGPGRAASAIALVVVIIALGVLPSVVVEPASVGAAGLLDPAAYQTRVLGGG